VELPHGGPASRDYAGFDWMAHFLATRGYTVLQPNFRGSAGYGTAWEKAGHGEWGIGVM
jgi:dipeptidyl aminopeptidase/acylaminoacyl peptidase